MPLSQSMCQHHCHTAPHNSDVMFWEGRREEVDELTLVMSVIQELWSLGPVNHSWLNLEITAGVRGTPDVVMTFW